MKGIQIMTKNITKTAIIAALYIVVSLAFSSLTYGPIQLRFSEALMLLCAFSVPGAIGVTIGCFITNLFSPYGMIDIFFGTGATLLAATGGYLLRKVKFMKLPILSAFCPVVANGVVLGIVLSYVQIGRFDPSLAILIGLQVAAGEAIACFVLGLPLYKVVERLRLL